MDVIVCGPGSRQAQWDELRRLADTGQLRDPRTGYPWCWSWHGDACEGVHDVPAATALWAQSKAERPGDRKAQRARYVDLLVEYELIRRPRRTRHA